MLAALGVNKMAHWCRCFLISTQTQQHGVPYDNNWCKLSIPQPKMQWDIILLNYICMSIWQVQIHQTAIWSSISQWNINKIYKDLPNVFIIGDNILIVGYDVNGRDYDKTPKWVLQIFQGKYL